MERARRAVTLHARPDLRTRRDERAGRRTGLGVTVVRRALAGSALRAGALAAAVVLTAGGCSLFDHKGEDTSSTSVFDVKPGDCFVVPKDITVELTDLSKVACTQPHEQEAYALVPYVDPSGATDASAFPGDAALKTFADGACAEQYESYVGVDYRDSTLYFTYLNPSARSWQQDADRTTVCFVTTTGQQLTKSVKGSKI
jgi:hypothetical protein